MQRLSAVAAIAAHLRAATGAVVAEAPGEGAGYWAGAPSAVLAPDGTGGWRIGCGVRKAWAAAART